MNIIFMDEILFIHGDWGLGIGDWGLGIGPNPQSPFLKIKIYIIQILYNYLNKIYINNIYNHNYNCSKF